MSDKAPTNYKPIKKGYNGQSIIAARLVNDGYNSANSVKTRQLDNPTQITKKPIVPPTPVGRSSPPVKSGKNE